jgi:hypothetical protein
MYVPPLLKPFETFMTSLGTQIMLPYQFVECLDHIKMFVELFVECLDHILCFVQFLFIIYKKP